MLLNFFETMSCPSRSRYATRQLLLHNLVWIHRDKRKLEFLIQTWELASLHELVKFSPGNKHVIYLPSPSIHPMKSTLIQGSSINLTTWKRKMVATIGRWNIKIVSIFSNLKNYVRWNLNTHTHSKHSTHKHTRILYNIYMDDKRKREK